METTKSMPALKAYLGRDEYEGKVVFATSKDEAERQTFLPVYRASEYDEWAAAGKVPTQVLIERFDWFFGCSYHRCGAECNNTGEMWDGDEYIEEPELTYEGDEVYCTPLHRDLEAAHRVGLKLLRQHMIDSLLAGWPGVTPGTVAVLNSPPWMEFKFPGCKVGGRWTLDATHVGITLCDLDAWDAFVAEKPAP